MVGYQKSIHPSISTSIVSEALTNRPLTRIRVSALAFLDSYRMCLSYLWIMQILMIFNLNQKISRHANAEKRKTCLRVFLFSLYRCIAFPRFWANCSLFILFDALNCLLLMTGRCVKEISLMAWLGSVSCMTFGLTAVQLLFPEFAVKLSRPFCRTKE